MDADERTPLQRRRNAKFPPPSRYFRGVSDLSPCRVVIYARESSRWQNADGNLKCQIALLRRSLRKLGFTVIKVFKEAASGQRHERPLLKRAAAYARRHNAVLVAEAVNRYVRSPHFHTQSFPNCPLHVDEMERIARIADGVTLATFLHPDTPEPEVRGYQTRRGISERARAACAARPAGYVKVLRDGKIEGAKRLAKFGYSTREIAGIFGMGHHGTVARWLKLKNETPGNEGA